MSMLANKHVVCLRTIGDSDPNIAVNGLVGDLLISQSQVVVAGRKIRNRDQAFIDAYRIEFILHESTIADLKY